MRSDEFGDMLMGMASGERSLDLLLGTLVYTGV